MHGINQSQLVAKNSQANNVMGTRMSLVYFSASIAALIQPEHHQPFCLFSFISHCFVLVHILKL